MEFTFWFVGYMTTKSGKRAAKVFTDKNETIAFSKNPGYDPPEKYVTSDPGDALFLFDQIGTQHLSAEFMKTAKARLERAKQEYNRKKNDKGGPDMEEKQFDPVKYKNEFRAKKYDNMSFAFKPGTREMIQEYAAKYGQSATEFVYQAILERIENKE